ncbi:hypothetical protein CCO46_20835 [Salmonella enterica subsp. enterica serovar Essen]|uniref:hypothetical protein n=1 Tax=Salmonella enterica TaxID=28901 RepID=UPI000BE22BE9|nr:hypothetical protein [Salmonella enterica]ECI9063374.1 hypothetical protein [Salmonella enterica subsp. enterica serovar Kentucky]EDX9414494.1 hypothetical protein [Salmonella enterica subsp. enterica serovar Ituri]EEC3906496.1 hypothetical protein [Salmonella enterica subsp. enterica serovar Kentucky]PDN05785.1 hypothetical protein CCO46_20835 [Salmonella enterica subsp. enterica serovar Essen]
MDLTKQQAQVLSRLANGEQVFKGEDDVYRWSGDAGGQVCTAPVKVLLKLNLVRIAKVKGGSVLRCAVTAAGRDYLKNSWNNQK